MFILLFGGFSNCILEQMQSHLVRIHLKCYWKVHLCCWILWQKHTTSSVFLLAVSSASWNVNGIFSFKNLSQSFLPSQSSHSPQTPGLTNHDVNILLFKEVFMSFILHSAWEELPSNLHKAALLSTSELLFSSLWCLCKIWQQGANTRAVRLTSFTFLVSLCSSIYSMSICFLYLLLNL